MTYLDASTSPHRFQWETNSEPSKAENCGPTCVTKIAQFYRDQWYGIEATRQLVTACCTPTTAWQQRDMLIKRGVPASVREIASVAELHGLVDSGRRPIVIGVLMSRVPEVYRDHPFLGWHALCVMKGGYLNGVRGFWINDPNFSPAGGIRPDADRGRKWYPDWVIQSAYIDNSPRYSVIPDSLKPVPVETFKGRGRVAGPNCNIRSSMSLSSSTNIYARSHTDGFTYRRSDGARLWANGTQYIFLGWSGDWAKVRTGAGLNLFIARSVFVVTVNP